MIYILLIILHVIACLVLICVILLQAGRGGGFGAVFGTESAQSLLGTQAPALSIHIVLLMVPIVRDRAGQLLPPGILSGSCGSIKPHL